MLQLPRVPKLLSRAISFADKFEQRGDTYFIDRAVSLGRDALQLCPPGHPGRCTTLFFFTRHLYLRYGQLGEMKDLEEAIVLDREALELCPQGDDNRPASLSNLALCLSTRYKRLGTERDLDEAIVLGREALDLCPPGDSGRSIALTNLGIAISTRFRRLGSMRDLEEAIVIGREALDLWPQGHPGRLSALSNLAIVLASRYDELRTVQDLDEAIVLGQEAVRLCPHRHPDRSTCLVNLAAHLSARYTQVRAVQDLDEAIVLDREALHLIAEGHPDRSMALSNLALHCFSRYIQLRTVEDLDETIVRDREALELRPEGHPDRGLSLSNLSLHLSARYKQFEKAQDIDEAIVLSREALHSRPHGHPSRSTSLENFAGCLCTRFTRFGRSEDKEEMFGLYTQLAHGIQIVSSADLSASKAWIRAAEKFQHPTLLLAYETSLQLLVQYLTTIPTSPQHLPVLQHLTSSLAVDAFSACLRNLSPLKAVEFLEQGRGVFWNQLTRLRSHIDDAVASGPAGKALAEEFTRLASLIRDSLDSHHKRAFGLSFELQKVVTNIRELPGLSRFLLPSSFTDLQRAASVGPIIIVSASKHGCDALIVLNDRDPIHVPLQITRRSVRNLSIEFHTPAGNSDYVTRDPMPLLRKLWHQVVSPIVDVLRTIHPLGSRVWWCPTAEFTRLPLHAAGPYTEGQQNLADLYISSYTPTLTSLICARREPSSIAAAGQKRFIAIGQAKAPGSPELRFVGPELDDICRRVGGLAAFTRLEGEASCVSRVIDELGEHGWVHLSCHGFANQYKPLASAFILHDGHLTVERIIRCNLKDAEFAYLSACSTTVGDVHPDEVIHLASAMQFVGFRSVIGTMKDVNEAASKEIASTFYRHMVDASDGLDYTRAAFALNETMKSADVPLEQRILYVHLGA